MLDFVPISKLFSNLNILSNLVRMVQDFEIYGSPSLQGCMLCEHISAVLESFVGELVEDPIAIEASLISICDLKSSDLLKMSVSSNVVFLLLSIF